MSKCCDPAPFSRRNFMLGAALTAAASVPLSRTAWAAVPETPNAIPPEAALQRLLQGNERYATTAPVQRDCSAGRAARVSAQYPIAAVLGCADSRVSPELLFDQGAGDLFVVRLAGNFVGDDGLASLEYAVKFLGVPLLVVLGHTNCGAVDAAIKVMKEGAQLPGHLPGHIESIKPAVITAQAQQPSDLLTAVIEENVKLNVARMHDDEPILSEALAAKKVAAVGCVYDLATGRVRLV